MKPRRPGTQIVGNLRKFPDVHFGELVVVDDGPAPGGLALDDVARGRLGEILSINAVSQFHAGLQCRLNLLGRNRRAGGEDSDQIQRCIGGVGRQLLQHFEGVGAVASAAMGYASCTELLILSGVMGGSGWVSVVTVSTSLGANAKMVST